MSDVIERAPDEPTLLDSGRRILGELISNDDWLPPQFAKSHPEGYRQYLLHCDPAERFSVVSFVWGPGHDTPIHDHTVWGLVGVMRGVERCEEFVRDAGGGIRKSGEHLVEPGGIDAVSPSVGDIHIVSNALENGDSVSIHVYGANIGAVRRHVYDAQTGAPSTFVSGYCNDTVPNLWDRSAEG